MLISHQSSIFDQVRLLLPRQLRLPPPSPMPPRRRHRHLARRRLAYCRLARNHCYAAGQPATAAAANHESIMIKSFDSCEVGNGGGGWCILHPVGISIFVHAHFLWKNEKRHSAFLSILLSSFNFYQSSGPILYLPHLQAKLTHNGTKICLNSHLTHTILVLYIEKTKCTLGLMYFIKV